MPPFNVDVPDIEGSTSPLCLSPSPSLGSGSTISASGDSSAATPSDEEDQDESPLAFFADCGGSACSSPVGSVAEEGTDKEGVTEEETQKVSCSGTDGVVCLRWLIELLNQLID